MASTGKKGKKNKGVAVSLQAFLANGNTQPGVTQVAKKVRNRFDESDEEDSHALPQIYQLPTAPRSTRFFDDDLIPNKPPFQAYISNLPFDVREDDINDFFGDLEIVSLRLPREDGESGRLRGFGYIEFGNRDDLIAAVRMPDPQIRNRRIRIDISNDSDQNKRGGNNRSRFDGFGSEGRDRDSNNWRTNDNKRDDGRRGGYGYNRDRQRDNSQEGGGGSWRQTERPSDSSPQRRSGFGDGFRERFGGRRDDYNRRSEEAPPAERPKLNLKPRTLPLPEIITKPEEEKDAESEEKSSTPEPPKPKPAGVAAEKVFGSAKPVDTAAREKEIEERRLERERQEKQRKMEEDKEKEKENENIEEKLEETNLGKDEKENTNTTSWRIRDPDTKQDDYHNYRKYSPDRRGPPRRNDDRRGGNQRDNRDSRDGRDRRDYNRGYDRDNKYRDNRDRNERSDRDRDQFNRDRAPYNKDNKNVRDTKPREDRPKKENRPDKPMPKYQPPSGGPVLSNSNKYSVFLDEDDASE